MGGKTHTPPPALAEIVGRWVERYGDRAWLDQLEHLVACSEFAGETVLRNKDWFLDNVGAAVHSRDGMRVRNKPRPWI